MAATPRKPDHNLDSLTDEQAQEIRTAQNNAHQAKPLLKSSDHLTPQKGLRQPFGWVSATLLEILSLICIWVAFTRRRAAFDNEKTETVFQQEALLQDAIFWLLASGFLFLGALLAALFALQSQRSTP